MQFTTGLILLTAATPIASAWTFNGYRDYRFEGGLILSLSGSYSTCINVLITVNDQLSSFQWARECNEFCEFTLWADTNCVGPSLITSREVTLNDGMTLKTNDVVSSLSVLCF
ncbi:hypothetical protein L211DRAFT_871642 [Terfezia boudieri ATCC MYA-4762]|uniref:Apple domain-containing protein n=1 Tax=Terfezia boudieri ATCC MYA-4762 TaxID=1051890 RepID=A0A3N4L759_9PEZI|nr:hypothetical protein L211DRAFT_871642 [Terfezia boudieri ATCC MYA-4762]